MKKHDTVWLFTYKDSLNHTKHMAIFTEDKKSALNQFHGARDATDRLIGEYMLTAEQYRAWKKSL